MAEELVSSLPPPPPFYKLYGPDTPAEEQPPPPKPVDGEFTMFGAAYSTENKQPTLEEVDREVLYNLEPDESGEEPIKRELKRLNKDLLSTFRALVGVLALEGGEQEDAGGASEEHIKRIELLLVNMHYLINLYRPMQARLTLLDLLDEQTEARQRATVTAQQTLNAVEMELSAAQQALAKRVEELAPIPESVTSALSRADVQIAAASGAAVGGGDHEVVVDDDDDGSGVQAMQE